MNEYQPLTHAFISDVETCKKSPSEETYKKIILGINKAAAAKQQKQPIQIEEIQSES